MNDFQKQPDALLSEAAALHRRNERAKTVTPELYDPGNMEYLAQSEGVWDPQSGRLLLRFESKGTRYDGRSELIERLRVGDPITVTRDPQNPYNPNNFLLLTRRGEDVGNMPAALCNAAAPLYDAGSLHFERCAVSFVEPLSKRSRHARQAVLFVELECRIAPAE